MQLASPRNTVQRPLAQQRPVSVATVRPVPGVRPSGLDGRRPGGASPARPEEQRPETDYRGLLAAALKANRQGVGEAQAAQAPWLESGAIGFEVEAAGKVNAPWRWNGRYGAATLASLYARMSGELVTLGRYVDARV